MPKIWLHCDLVLAILPYSPCFFYKCVG